jgi:diacylglycerol kinase
MHNRGELHVLARRESDTGSAVVVVVLINATGVWLPVLPG